MLVNQSIIKKPRPVIGGDEGWGVGSSSHPAPSAIPAGEGRFHEVLKVVYRVVSFDNVSNLLCVVK
jgi:hypothetical protein